MKNVARLIEKKAKEYIRVRNIIIILKIIEISKNVTKECNSNWECNSGSFCLKYSNFFLNPPFYLFLK